MFFRENKNKITVGAIIEVGSGSVAVGIVKSSSTQKNPEIIWGYRELASSRYSLDGFGAAKDILKTIERAVTELGTTGVKSLKEHKSSLRINEVQVSIAAPWSYTATSTVNYRKDKEFKVTKSIIEKITTEAAHKINSEVTAQEEILKLGLEIISQNYHSTLLNGYQTIDPVNQVTNLITLNQITSISQKKLVDTLDNELGKILPKVPTQHFSFMYLFFEVIKYSLTHYNEYCLVDITDNATEIGVVRNGILQYCTHTPVGKNSLIYLLSERLKIPFEEAASYVRSTKEANLWEQLSTSQRETVEDILSEYQNELAKLFHETGDGLTIPRLFFIHSDKNTELFFNEQIVLAANQTTKTKHQSRSVSTELLSHGNQNEEGGVNLPVSPDTASLIAALFFHINHQ